MQLVQRVMTEPVERVDHLPDGSAGLCFLLFAANDARLVAIGPYTKALYTRPRPFVLAIHVSLPPGTAFTYFGVPVETLANRGVPLRELWSTRADHLLDDLLALGTATDAATMHARHVLLETALAERARTGSVAPGAAIVRAAVHRLARATAPIRDLAADLHISDRGLRRAFATSIGVSPKAYARIARFRRVAALAPGARGRWASLASAAGYADQAHLANEFRELARVSPSAFVRPDALDALRVSCPIVG